MSKPAPWQLKAMPALPTTLGWSTSLLVRVALTPSTEFMAHTQIPFPCSSCLARLSAKPTLRSYNLPDLRQLGDQETDIISLAANVTKYAVTIFNPQEIRFHLEKAWHLAQTGRPGPCWLDIPIDVQSSQVDKSMLEGFTPPETDPAEEEILCEKVKSSLDKIKAANRPVILAGTGVRSAGAVEMFNTVVHKLGIPVTTAWTHDLIASDDPLFCGRPGTIGTRSGNFTVQNSDVLLILGSRLNIRQTGYTWNSFARGAYKIWVDVDPAGTIQTYGQT